MKKNNKSLSIKRKSSLKLRSAGLWHINNHSRVFLSGISASFLNKVETPDYKFRGWIKAFTLIELLVVVLIIGILAAIAVPQYQTTVIKTKFTSFFPLIHSIKDSQERYYMANGYYSVSLNDLDIGVPFFCEQLKIANNVYSCGKDWMIDNQTAYGKAEGVINLSYCPNYSSNSDYASCYSNRIVKININYDHSNYTPGKKYCSIGKKGEEIGRKLCKLFMGWTD